MQDVKTLIDTIQREIMKVYTLVDERMYTYADGQ